MAEPTMLTAVTLPLVTCSTNSLYGSCTSTLLRGMKAHAFQTMRSASISHESGPNRNGGGPPEPPGPRPGSCGRRYVDLRSEPGGSCERGDVLSAISDARQAPVLVHWAKIASAAFAEATCGKFGPAAQGLPRGCSFTLGPA